MALQLKKVALTGLRKAGLDEKWLQDRIKEDPSILGLGELEIVSREHRQPFGGRIDFLTRDSETYYEVVVMLGTLDESHIIRTIEYWDIERQRRPQVDHRAVIVAEQITSRFFNVLRLLNRAVPMIAVQLSAFRLNEADIVLHPVTVLNISEELPDDAELDPAESADRPYWEKKSSPEFLAVVDKLAAIVRSIGNEPKITYNRYHIALGTTGYNFCWLSPRRAPNTGAIIVRLNPETRDDVLTALQSAGIDASLHRTDGVSLRIAPSVVDAHKDTLSNVFKQAEDWSNR